MKEPNEHIHKLARGVVRMNYLKSHGFTQQNNTKQYQEKLEQQNIHTEKKRG